MDENQEAINQLSKLQLLLKKEAILEKYHASELKQITAELQAKYNLFEYINKVNLSLQLYSMDENVFSLQNTFFKSLVAPMGNALTSPYLKNDTKINSIYSKQIRFFLSTNDFKQLANACYIYANTFLEADPLQFDKLCFIIIPGFFQYFSTEENYAQFFIFMKNIFQKSQDIGFKFARLLFLLPSFKLFLNEITSQLQPPEKIQDLTKGPYVKNFCALFEENICYCPRYLADFLKICPNKVTFLQQSFIIPGFNEMRAYGLSSFNAVISEEVKNAIISSMNPQAKHLVKIIERNYMHMISPIIVPKPVKEIVEPHFLFSVGDLMIINRLSELCNQTVPKLSTDKNCDYVVYTIPMGIEVNPINEPEQLQLSKECEYNLRALICSIHDIPIGNKADNVRMVIENCCLSIPEEQRLSLQLKVFDTFKSMQRIDGQNDKTILQTLENEYNKRKTKRLNNLARLSQYNNADLKTKKYSQLLYQQVVDPNVVLFEYQIIEKWHNETNPFANINISKVTESVSSFADYYKSIIDNFLAWSSRNGFPQIHKLFYIFDLTMNHIPLRQFISNKPELASEDEAFYSLFSTNKDALDSLTKESKSIAALLQRKKSIQPFINLIRDMEKAPSLMEKFGLFVRCYQEANLFLATEKRMGADDTTPLIMSIIFMAQPRHWVSTIRYIEFFYINLPMEWSDAPIQPMDNYITTFLVGTLTFFNKEIQS